MKESKWTRSVTAAFLLLTSAVAHAAFYREPQLYDPSELIVQYRSPMAAVAAKSAQAALGLQLQRSLDDGRTQLLRLPAFTRFEQAAALLQADPDVELVEPNYIRRTRIALPDDPLFAQQWGLYSTGQRNFATDDPALASIPGADMNLPAAWDSTGDGIADRTGSSAVVVAVIDDAFDIAHPDLAANFAAGRNFTDDGDPNDPRPDAGGLLSHGTLVAGSLGAVGNNGQGIAGVAWEVSMMPLRVGRVRDNQAQLSNAAILEAYAHARQQGAHIVNASYGGPCYSQAEFSALQSLEQAGILFVTSAGNFNSNLDYSTAAYPANYPLRNVVAVAATNRQDNIASFSQYGPVSTDVAAPGLQIVTTSVGGGYVTGQGCGQGGRCGVNGTSFASPHVAGIAALIKSVHPGADDRELRARLIEGAEDGVAGGDAGELSAGGRVDAANSLELAPRPALVIRPTALPVQDLSRGPCRSVRPSRVVNLIDDGNRRLDPGETLEIELQIENLWQSATNVQARLIAPDIVTVQSPVQALGTLVQDGTAPARFTIAVGTPASAYLDLPFAVELSANGGAYQTRRPFRLELARLALQQPVQARLSEGLHDEFHTYHLDVPAVPANARLMICTAASKDIDVLVKRGRPAQYDIDLGAPVDDDPTFFSDADHVGGAEDGNEIVEIGNPQTGTYYITVLNYALADRLDYALEAFFAPTDAAAAGQLCSVDAPSRGGGGGLGPVAVVALLLLALGRRRRSRSG